MKRFKQYVSEQKQKAIVSFTSINPPTAAHFYFFDKLYEASHEVNGKHFIYVYQHNDANKNPLLYEQKINYARKMFPRHARNIIQDHTIKTEIDALVSLYEKNYKDIIICVSDEKYDNIKNIIETYNGKQTEFGYFKFKEVKVVNLFAEDPDNYNSSKLRAAASHNDYESFIKSLPKQFNEGKDLFNDVRKGIGLKESHSFRQHIEFKPVNKERDSFINGELFSEGDKIKIKESDEIGFIQKLGSNYLIIESNGKKCRKWITDVEKVIDK